MLPSRSPATGDADLLELAGDPRLRTRRIAIPRALAEAMQAQPSVT